MNSTCSFMHSRRMLWVGPGRDGQWSFDLWVDITVVPGWRSRQGDE